MAWSRASTAAATVLLLALAGCSSDTPPATSTTPSGSPTAATTTPAAEPAAKPEKPPKAPEAKPGPEGQKAFARHVVALWGYALRTNDATPLLALSPSKKQLCQGCAELQSTLKKRVREGYYADFQGAAVKAITLTPAEGSTVARATVRIPPSRTMSDDGLEIGENKGFPKADFIVRLRFVKPRYQLLSFTVDAPGAG